MTTSIMAEPEGRGHESRSVTTVGNAIYNEALPKEMRYYHQGKRDPTDENPIDGMASGQAD
jgi:hypothetical protein